MKSYRPLLCALAAGLLLTSCGGANANPPELTTTRHQSESTTANTSEPITKATSATTRSTSGWMDIPLPLETVEEDGVSYLFYNEILVGIHSDEETVKVASVFVGPGENAEVIEPMQVYVDKPIFGINSTDEIRLPNCRELIFDEGYQLLQWSGDRVKIPQIGILRLPSTLKTLDAGEQEALIPLVEQHLKEAAVPYDPDSRSIYGTSQKLSEFVSEEDFYDNQRYTAVHGLFTDWENLSYISVAAGNDVFYDIAGVLYGDESWDCFGIDHLLYHPTLSEIPLTRLICLPQSYTCPTGTYTVPEGTQYIHSGGIYRPKNIDVLIVPDSLTYLAPASIVASADRPLTVVCSPDSAAAQYVTQFGELYHLTLQWNE